MDKFDRATIQRLTDDNDGPCVSIFMETHLVGKDAEQDAIRLKNLVREAERRLSGHWLSAPKARDLLQRVSSLPLNLSFWQDRRQGLAVFVSPTSFDALRVNRPLAEHLSVANRFRVRPLLPLLEDKLSFYLLVVSENRVACYAIDDQSIEQVTIPDLPTSLNDSLADTSRTPVMQAHTAMHGVSGKQAAVFHGQGGQADRTKDMQLAFCAQIDNAVTRWLRDSTRLLLLACVESLAAIYRQKNSYSGLLPELLAGNWDRSNERDLQQRATSIVAPIIAAEAAKLATRYQQQVGTPNALDDPVQVVEAALQGRVDTLFYDAKCELYGAGEPSGNKYTITGSSDDEDLVDLAAVATLRHRGTIQNMATGDLCTNSPLAAILRY